MLKSISVSSENIGETDDLLITPYLQKDRLPQLLNQVLPLAATPEEQDMLLLSSLTAVSACLPKVAFRYGHTGKTYYPNLQTFIMAGSASGKGIAETAKQLVAPLDSIELHRKGQKGQSFSCPFAEHPIHPLITH